MPLRTSDSLGYQVNLLARMLEHALRDRVASYGVVPGQFPALLSLYEHGELTQAELCQLVAVEQPTMARTLQRMERDGLVRREKDPHDARQMRIMLTDYARQIQEPLAEAATEVNSMALASFSAEHVQDLLDKLASIKRDLNRTE